jgi:hypothetical protein
MPEAYFDRKGETPAALVIDPSPLAGQPAIVSDTLGSFSLITLLRTTVRDAEAVEAAQGWRGDRYVVWGEKMAESGEANDADMLGWISEWSSHWEAKAFAKAIWLTFTQRYSIPNDPSYARPEGGYGIDQANRSLLIRVVTGADDAAPARVILANSQKISTTQEIEKRLLQVK